VCSAVATMGVMSSVLALGLVNCAMAQMPTGVPSTQNTLSSGEFAVHRLCVVFDASTGRALKQVHSDEAGVTQWSSGPIESAFPFNELIPSWNLVVPNGAAYRIDLRVRTRGTGRWAGPYLFEDVGYSTSDPTRPRGTIEDEYGKVNTDYLICAQPCDAFEVRVATRAASVRRLAAVYSNTTGDRALWEKFGRQAAAGTAGPTRGLHEMQARQSISHSRTRLDVPFMTQHVEDAAMLGNICSPTSVAMVMAYRGVKRRPEEVARAAFDPVHRIYGNWPRNVQAAYSFGVPGYVTRFASMEEAEACIAAGQPIIASIRDPEGRLEGTPYKTTTGHLLVICGFDANGDVLVNDPAGRTQDAGQLTYKREQFEEAWLRNGGVAYILEKP